MNKFLLAILASLFLLPLAQAHDHVLKVKAKNYYCADLYDLVQEEEVVHIKGFGSLDVYAESKYACSNKNCVGRNVCETYKSHWPTKDRTFCFAGYACRSYSRSER